jgi:prolipoprotein diacylglyceryltransferase
MELLAYTGAFQLYLALRRRGETRGDAAVVPFEQNAWILVGAVFGALFGSKLLAWAETPQAYFGNAAAPHAWIGGKTIVGGLLGGWVGVEIAKRFCHVRYSTGDLTVFPLALGMAVGRIGCFLTGLEDHTCGSHTTVPWAVDFGDGPRHPAQLYDILFLTILGVALAWISRNKPRAEAASDAPGLPALPNGVLFRIFLTSYLLYRFAIEFLKDRDHPYAGLSAIQWACLIGAVTCLVQIFGFRSAKVRPVSVAAT